ncbi:MAG: LuxR C-terminal-related transcriptional regulator [Coxiellaceae bacterium]|nr:LuxR C-terminal-related transcriptional regulator [Coxiellaceae bacterium]
MRCEQISVQRSIQAFYNDLNFIKKINGINGKSVLRPPTRRKRRFMMLSTQHTFELSKRQTDVLSHMKRMSSRKRIAETMNISIKTLEDHLLVMRKKMHCNTVQMMFDAVQSNLLLEAH